jgi:hypothetical protein
MLTSILVLPRLFILSLSTPGRKNVKSEKEKKSATTLFATPQTVQLGRAAANLLRLRRQTWAPPRTTRLSLLQLLRVPTQAKPLGRPPELLLLLGVAAG